jgi:hypothetical protein
LTGEQTSMAARFALLTAGALAALTLTAQAGAQQPCTRIHTVGGVKVRTYCGPARVTLHVRGKTYRISGGYCYRAGTAFALTAGSGLAGPPTPASFTQRVKLPFFSISTLAAPRDGTYTKTEIQYALPGDRVSFVGTIVPRVSIRIQGGRSRGSFTGHDGVPISGTFHC